MEEVEIVIQQDLPDFKAGDLVWFTYQAQSADSSRGKPAQFDTHLGILESWTDAIWKVRVRTDKGNDVIWNVPGDELRCWGRGVYRPAKKEV